MSPQPDDHRKIKLKEMKVKAIVLSPQHGDNGQTKLMEEEIKKTKRKSKIKHKS